MFYFGKVVTATEVGRRMVSVRCEKCQTAFWYELSRVAVGQASAPYYLFQESAERRADRQAKRDLARRLEEDAELVPCPKCHWVNQELVNRYQNGLYRRAPMLIVGALAVGIIGYVIAINLVTGNSGYGPYDAVTRRVGNVVLVVGLLAPVWVLLPRRLLRERVDPNATYPRPPSVPPGTPVPLIEQRDPSTGETYLTEAAANREEPPPPPGRELAAVVRVNDFHLPWVCCVCLRTAIRPYKSPFKLNEESDLAVPLCSTCSMRLTLRWWLLAPLAALAAAGAAGVGALVIPGMDEIGRWITFTVLALFGVLFAVAVVPNMLCRPYRLKVIDNDRAIIRFAARNPAYTRLVIEQSANPPDEE